LAINAVIHPTVFAITIKIIANKITIKIILIKTLATLNIKKSTIKARKITIKVNKLIILTINIFNLFLKLF